ncbi:hypothetical protein N3K66_007569 [Trichothecium roseum]|uniref:Uncharacterized protein n=1 Tax=Trichothecium roseum TaxID=47278 RepID=A0ACC0UUP5_9HYPO|nr:hypothetical protein N3K66_007569 [Trichothecium roseum]
MTSHVHIVNKDNLAVHKTVTAPAPTSPLAPGHVRVKPEVLGITLNNRSYALLGDLLAWWSAYPVPPEAAPAPAGDGAPETRWGIVPAWGYGRVLESNGVQGISAGDMLQGFWPTSSRPVDLRLEPHGAAAGGEGFDETSAHRAKLMTIYNRYVVTGEARAAERSVEDLAWESNCAVVWGAGWIFTEYVFAPAPREPVTPLGDTSVPWTREDADVGSAVVVNLAASSKTAMAISFGFRRRNGDQSPPLAVLDVTSSPGRYPKAQLGGTAAHRVVSYEDLSSAETLAWIGGLKASRVVLIDSGAPPGTAQTFHDALFASSSSNDAATTTTLPQSLYYIPVGAGPTELSAPDAARAKRFQFNTSPVIDVAEARDGVAAVRAGRHRSFVDARAAGMFDGLELVVGQGVAGEGGIEGAWGRIVGGTFPRDKALAFKL